MKNRAIICLIVLLCFIMCGCTNRSQNREIAQTAAPVFDFMPDMTALPSITASPEYQSLPEAVDRPVDDLMLTIGEDDSATADAEDTLPSPEFEEEEDDVGGDNNLSLEAQEDASTPDEPDISNALPTIAPASNASSNQPQLTMLTDTSFGFVFAYPSSWQNLPGKNTVCFVESNPSGDFPARVAVAKKRLPHKPSNTTLYNQFRSFAGHIYYEYDPKTFMFSTVNENASMMGQKAYEVSYLAYSGNTEIEGYMCCCAVGYTVYVFHFCSAYDQFQQMTPLIQQMRSTLTAIS